jgi:hypothetical protein
LSFPGKKWAVIDETNQFPFFTANLLPAITFKPNSKPHRAFHGLAAPK